MTQQKKITGANAGYAHRVLPAGLSRPAGYIAKGLAAASVAGLVTMAAPVSKADAAARLTPKPRDGNPLLMPVGAAYRSKPAVVDFDRDGDLDMFVGGEDGKIQYFENAGTASAPDFQLRLGGANPFWYKETVDLQAPPSEYTYTPYDVGTAATPALADLDGDGDLDAVVGSSGKYGQLDYFENIEYDLVRQNGTSSPVDFYNYDNDAAPAFADIDGDGDLDLFTGDRDDEDTIRYFENTGTATAPAFDTSPDSDPFGLYSTGSYSTPTFVDIDSDGDLDAFIGKEYGEVDFFKNVGTAEDPDFELQDSEATVCAPPFVVPLETIDTGMFSAPAFADIDGDGDLDAFVGGTGEYYNDMVFFYENTGTPESPAFTKRDGKSSPTWGFDTGYNSTPVLADIDGDGDLDAFIGNEDGYVLFSENTGTATNPNFQPISMDDNNNPFNGVDVGDYSHPAFVDIDGDGDLDAFIGEYDEIYFYENFGTATAPDFVARPADNPFADSDLGYYNAPTFFDIDGDGDWEAFVGNVYGIGEIYFYDQDANGDFVRVIERNPFRDFNVGNRRPKPAIGDFDGDGTLEAFVGSYNGQITYYEYIYDENEEEAPSAVGTMKEFVENDAYDDVDMGLLELINYTAPTAGDIDGDGDLDVFIGEKYGRMIFVENETITAASDETTPRYRGGSSSSSTCFIDSIDIETKIELDDQTGSPFQTVNRMVQRIKSRLASWL